MRRDHSVELPVRDDHPKGAEIYAEIYAEISVVVRDADTPRACMPHGAVHVA